MAHELSGRSYAGAYQGVHRRRHHEFIERAVARSGARVVATTGGSEAPLFLSVEEPNGERLGICVYVFLANRKAIRNRPQDEHRLQVRYGDVNDPAWRRRPHPIGYDPLGVDVTLVVGAHLDDDLLIGLDPLLYDPLPIGISIEFKAAELDQAQQAGWHVWERDNISGAKRKAPRAPAGLETVVALSALNRKSCPHH